MTQVTMLSELSPQKIDVYTTHTKHIYQTDFYQSNTGSVVY